MGDDDGGSAFHFQKLVQRRLHQPLALDVKRRRRFVQNQHGRILTVVGKSDGGRGVVPAGWRVRGGGGQDGGRRWRIWGEVG